jgi:DNA methylase
VEPGGLRRLSAGEPFKDLIASAPARGFERRVAPHPSLKPQAFLRQLTRAALPLGEGVILDPFMGSGSTTAAAAVFDLHGIGLEINPDYFQLAAKAIPLLAEYTPTETNGHGMAWRGSLACPARLRQNEASSIIRRHGTSP